MRIKKVINLQIFSRRAIKFLQLSLKENMAVGKGKWNFDAEKSCGFSYQLFCHFSELTSSFELWPKDISTCVPWHIIRSTKFRSKSDGILYSYIPAWKFSAPVDSKNLHELFTAWPRSTNDHLTLLYRSVMLTSRQAPLKTLLHACDMCKR